MYIAFIGLSFGGKKHYQAQAAEYLYKVYNMQNNIQLIADPKSSKLGELVIGIGRTEYKVNLAEEGLLYLASNINTYNMHIYPNLDKHLICRGNFTEILPYQGNLSGDKGFTWEEIKTFFQKSLETTHQTNDIVYPDVIFVCINSYQDAHLKMQIENFHGQEFHLSTLEYNQYNDKFIESYNIISQDEEFTAHTKLVLVDGTKSLSSDLWYDIIKPEIDLLLDNKNLSTDINQDLSNIQPLVEDFSSLGAVRTTEKHSSFSDYFF